MSNCQTTRTATQPLLSIFSRRLFFDYVSIEDYLGYPEKKKQEQQQHETATVQQLNENKQMKKIGPVMYVLYKYHS